MRTATGTHSWASWSMAASRALIAAARRSGRPRAAPVRPRARPAARAAARVLPGVRAARVEGAARRRVRGDGTSPDSTMRWRCALGSARARRRAATWCRDGGAGVQGGRGCALHDLAEVHHRHVIRDVLDDREIVGDEEVGEPPALLQVGEQVSGPAPGPTRRARSPARRGRELRLDREGAAIPHAAAAARELVRVALREARIETHFLEQAAMRRSASAPRASRWIASGRRASGAPSCAG